MKDNNDTVVEPAVTPAADETPPPPAELDAERAPEAPQAPAMRSAAEMIEQLRNETPEQRERRPLLARVHQGARVLEIRKGDVVYRAADMAKRGIDVEARTVELTFSSENPIDRGWCIEILDHSPGCVRMERMLTGAAVLMDHNWTDQVGVVEDPGLTGDRRHRAKARFGRSVRSSEVFQDVVDDIRRHISVGYFIYEVEETQLPGGGLQYRVTDWEPFEISFVSVPADISVGTERKIGSFGLSYEAPVTVVNREVGVMPETTTMDREAIRKEEQKRQKDIRELGEKFGQADLATRLIDSGADYDAARLQVLEAIGAARQVTQEEIRKESMIGMTDDQVSRFSVNRLLLSLADKNPALAPFERECSAAAAVKMGRQAQGAFLPVDVMARFARARRMAQVGRRDIASSGTGAYLIGTDHLDGEFIEMLRPVSALTALGARVIDGLVGSIDIPRRDTGATFYVINNETTGVTESTPAFGQVTGSPKTVAARVDLTRKMLLQSSPAADALTRDDMMIGMGLKVDNLGINGSGVAPNPTGLHAASSTNAVVGGTDGLAPSWSHVVQLESEVAMDNALVGNSGYLFSAKAQGFFKRTEKASGTAQFIMNEGNMLNGHKVVVSNQCSDVLVKGGSGAVCSELFFSGAWSDLLLLFWGSMDLKVDDITNADYGGLVLRIFQDMDIGIRHPESFAIMKDAKCA